MKPRYLLVLLPMVVLLSVLSQCGGEPKPKKKLTDNVRPLQLGTEIGLGSQPDDEMPHMICSFGFYAQRTDQYPAPEGLVTALHCTNIIEVTSGEPIWQSRPENSTVIARVDQKPGILWGGETVEIDGSEYNCPYWWGDYAVDYCIPADAVFAAFYSVQDDDLWPGAVANVPLSTDSTELTLVDERKFDKQTGVLTDPLPGEIAYKIGRTTGKTRMHVVEEVPGQFVKVNGDSVVFIRLFKAVDMWDDPAPLIDHGDSGGPVFHNFRDASDGYVLTGIAVLMGTSYGSEALYIEPVSDIKRMLPVEPEYAGFGGVMHAGVGQ